MQQNLKIISSITTPPASPVLPIVRRLIKARVQDKQSLALQAVHAILIDPAFQRVASIVKLPPKAPPSPFGVKKFLLEGRVRHIVGIPAQSIRHKRLEAISNKISRKQALELLNIPEVKENDFPFIEAQYNKAIKMVKPKIELGPSPMQEMVDRLLVDIESAYAILKQLI